LTFHESFNSFLYFCDIIKNDNNMKEQNTLIDEFDEDLKIDSSVQPKKNLYPIEALKVEKAFYSVFELKRKFDKNLIKLDADFQRDEVWNSRQKIELIESILMGLPLPIFYFNRDKDGVLVVVDGRQRLGAMFDYMNDKFALKDLNVLSSDFEKKFSDLEQLYQSKIEDYQLQAYEIMPETPESVIFNIFDRVNRGGTKLNKQEIRNALYQGKATVLLKEYVKSDLFLTATGKGLLNDNRQKAHYIILRFIAFYLLKNGCLKDSLGKLYLYKDIDELLSIAMQNINEMSDEKYNSLKNSITLAFHNCVRYTDEEVFRLNQNGKRSPINMNVFETVMYIMAFLPETLNTEKVSTKIEALKHSFEFIDNIGNHRDSELKVKQRFAMADKIIEELKND